MSISKRTFGELVRLGVLQVGDGHRAKVEELGGGGPAFLRAGALSVNGFDWSDLESFTPDAESSLSGKLGCVEDVVITTKGNSIGRVGRVPRGAPTFVYSPHLSFWRSIDTDVVNSGYLYYWSRSQEFGRQLRNLAFGTDMAPYLSLRDQLRLTIFLPEITRQRAVSEVLVALDDKIAANEAVIGRSELLMTALASAAITPATTKDLATRSSRVISPGDFPASVSLFSLPAFDNGAAPERTTRETIKSGKFALETSAVLVSKLNPRISRVWNIDELPGLPAVASTEFVVLQPKEVSSSLLWSALKQPAVSAELAGKVAGTSGSHQRVKPEDVLNLVVPDPRALPPRVQREIDLLGRRAASARREIPALAITRDELLPLLMSGRLRVKDAEKAAEDVL